jgi:hypothetical protein
MSKKKRAIGVGRMSPAAIAAVVAEIDAYGRRERAGQLTWKALSEFSGFSHVSLWKKPAIKIAFAQVRQSQRVDATPTMKAPKTGDERVLGLQEAIEDLRSTVRAYDELWALYEHNMQRLGIDPSELRKPLDSLARETVRNRRMRAVR